jgi:opacity protein-like surface antigen
MTRLAAIAIVLAATSSVASAGTYLGLGIGTAVGGSWEDSASQGGDIDGFERSGRLFGGYRISKVSFEAQGSRFALAFGTPFEYQGTQLAANVKLSLPLGNNFEVFGRGGLARTWVSSRGDLMDDSAGTGWLLGLGAEYRINLGVTGASIFVDYQRSSTTFASDLGGDWDGSLGMWTLGASVSL